MPHLYDFELPMPAHLFFLARSPVKRARRYTIGGYGAGYAKRIQADLQCSETSFLVRRVARHMIEVTPV